VRSEAAVQFFEKNRFLSPSVHNKGTVSPSVQKFIIYRRDNLLQLAAIHGLVTVGIPGRTERFQV
jgi:hypothetical protein